MNSIIKHTVFALFVGAIMVSCGNSGCDSIQDSTEVENSELATPSITEKGVEPFCLGASLYSIPPSGVFYDTIVLRKYYCVIMGDHAVNVDEEGLKQYYQMFTPDEYEEYVAFHGIGFVLKAQDTIISFEYDKDATILKLQITTPELKLSNGIHVGMKARELINSYNAKVEIEETSEFYVRILKYSINGIHPDIKLISKYLYSEFDLRKENDDDVVYYIPDNFINEESLGTIMVYKAHDEWDYYYPIKPHQYHGTNDYWGSVPVDVE